MINAIKNLFGIGPKVDYAELVKQGAIILDVRSKGEYQGGHIKGSINISVDSLSSNLNKLKKDYHLLCKRNAQCKCKKHFEIKWLYGSLQRWRMEQFTK